MDVLGMESPDFSRAYGTGLDFDTDDWDDDDWKRELINFFGRANSFFEVCSNFIN
jgi:hypothetical protein